MAVEEAPTRASAQARTACPNCSAPADPGQLVCLECGARLGLDYRRRSRLRPVTPILAVAALAAAAGLGFGLRAITADDGTERASAPASDRGAVAGESRSRAERDERTADQRPEQEQRAPRGEGGVREWPDGRDAYTVVLLSAGDEESARGRARELIADDIQAGVLESGLYPSLEAGFWIVFSGVYETQEQAQQAAQRLAERAPGSFPQFVNGRERRSEPASPEPDADEDTSTGSSTAPSSGQPDE